MHVVVRLRLENPFTTAAAVLRRVVAPETAEGGHEITGEERRLESLLNGREVDRSLIRQGVVLFRERPSGGSDGVTPSFFEIVWSGNANTAAETERRRLTSDKSATFEAF
jgi:hypothetical protein